MTGLEGIYDCHSKTPMGEQQSVLVVTNDAGQYSATINFMGQDLVFEDLVIDESRVTWRMTVSIPFVIPLKGSATIDGNQIEGTLDAGPFGTFPVRGQKRQ